MKCVRVCEREGAEFQPNTPRVLLALLGIQVAHQRFSLCSRINIKRTSVKQCLELRKASLVHSMPNGAFRVGRLSLPLHRLLQLYIPLSHTVSVQQLNSRGC